MRNIISYTILFTMLLGSGSALAASSFEPAFKTLGIWDEKKQIRVDLNIWYPTYSRPSLANYAPWTLNVVRYGRAAKGRFPLLLLSHDSTATRFSYHETAALLTKSGFVIIAPAHKNDNLNNLAHPFSLRQLTERVEELKIALNVALTNKAINESIDPKRVGVLGFGMGGSAALLLGNAIPSASEWDNYCSQANSTSIYCGQWARGRIQSMVNALPLRKSLGLSHVKAVAAVAPSLSMLFDKKALQYFSAKLLLIEAEKDSVNLRPWNTHSLVENFPEAPNFAQIEGVDLEDLMSACPPSLREGLDDICGRASPSVKYEAHKILNDELIKFFLENLGHVSE